MCTLNGARFISEQLDSIFQQTERPDELLVVDDGSTDGTVELVKSLFENAPIHAKLLVNSQRMGATRNFASAIDLVAGDIIVLADQDDVWDRTKLAKIRVAFDRFQDVGLVFTDGEVVDHDLVPLGYTIWEYAQFSRQQRRHMKEHGPLGILLKHNVVTGMTMAFRRAYKEVVLPIPVIWVHDAWIALILSFVTKFAVIEEPLVSYRQHSGNQIGAVRGGISKAFMSRRGAVDDYLNIARQYEAAYERVRSLPPDMADQRSVARLQRKVLHVKTRLQLARSGSFRTLMVEFAAMRYFRYGLGLRSALKDFLVVVNHRGRSNEGTY